MNEETQDQVSQDTQGEQVQEQSEVSEQETAEPKLYKLPDGREVTADDLYSEHTEKLLPEFTRRSQELADYKREREAREAKAQAEAQSRIEENELIKNVDPNVREAIVQMVKPVIAEALQQKDLELEKQARDVAFRQQLDQLREKFPGGNGLPKFNEATVLAAMRDPNNSIYDPEVMFFQMNKAAFIDYEIKQAMKQKSTSTKTEDTGGTPPRKPQEKVPRTFEEAGKSAFQRLMGK